VKEKEMEKQEKQRNWLIRLIYWLFETISPATGLDQLGHDSRLVTGPTSKLDAYPRGFGHVRPDYKSKAFLDMQAVVTDAIFARLGLGWVPGEFLDLLDRHPEPIDAFRELCRRLGLVPDEIGRGEREAVSRLHERVGVLLSLSAIRDVVPPDVHRHISDQLRAGLFDSAAETTERLRHFHNVWQSSQGQVGTIAFPFFDEFVKQLDAYRKNPLSVDDEDVAEARGVMFWFKKTWERFADLKAALDGMLMWIKANWPDNDWGEENAPIANGLATYKAKLEAQLLGEEAYGEKTVPDNRDIEEMMTHLERVQSDIEYFIGIVQKHYKGAAYDAPEKRDDLRKAAWDALAELHLDPRAIVVIKEKKKKETIIKKTYCKLAFACHPDRWAGTPKERAMTRRFQELARARATVEEAMDFGLI
jgi:hypothetical protein